MYEESDFHNAARKMRGNLWITLVLLAIGIGFMCVGLGLRIKWLVLISPILGAWLAYTWMAVRFLPWFRYNRYLLNMRNGRKRVTECIFLDVADRVRVVDGVQIHDLNAAIDEACEDTRLFYWDNDKPLPQISKGQRVRLTSYGNFIIGFESL